MKAATPLFGRAQRKTNRDRILTKSLELFNQVGTDPITTNHISAELKLSPGNLYFHFQNKEEIIRVLFQHMIQAIYQFWGESVSGSRVIPPLEFFRKSFETFWAFRFFHREMYVLRRRDPKLARLWKYHLRKSLILLNGVYARWAQQNWMKAPRSPREAQILMVFWLTMMGQALQVYENRERQPRSRSLDQAVDFSIWLFRSYFEEAYWTKLERYHQHFR